MDRVFEKQPKIVRNHITLAGGADWVLQSSPFPFFARWSCKFGINIDVSFYCFLQSLCE